MTFGVYFAGSVPLSALPTIAAGAILGNNTTSTGTVVAMTGGVPATNVVTTGTLPYTGINTVVTVAPTANTTYTMAVPVSANVGAEFQIFNTTAFIATIAAAAGTTINGQATWPLPAQTTGIDPSLTLYTESTTVLYIK
jgi:hypothetical protein